MYAALTLGQVLCMKQILLVLHLFVCLYLAWPRQEWIFKKIVSVLSRPHQCNCSCTFRRKKKSRPLNTTQNCIPNGGKFVSNIWQGNEHDLAKNSAHSSSASMKVPHKYSQNLYYLLKACIIMALKTSCASRSLITFLLVYREQDNHHQMPSTIRYLMPQN